MTCCDVPPWSPRSARRTGSARPTVVAQVRREDRVRAVEELTGDEVVAATVTTGLLRRPDVAFRAMSDDCPDYRLAA
ncbi:DUF6192 family protein [Streptomyces sp. NBC_00328]|uniref:DUF6192 family protein n=1 Tax=Streptomyces sp. NBC_00328 TaxID=2903646 RepID=UPI002E298BAB|nr:DUF6192 family protein [Streptomyces sp. NBC_00328]